MRALITGLSVSLLLAVVGCDANAKNKGKDKATEVVKPSKELESCSASRDCSGELRCFANRCVSPKEVLLGEYYARVGDVSLAKRNMARAAEAYDEAVKQYQAKNKQPPARIYCGWGKALLADERDPDKPELAAKVLHRCLRGAPIGSPLRAQALRLLARLDELGLNPVTLPSQNDATKYLKGKRKPAADKVKVKVTSPIATKRNADDVINKLKDATLRPQFVACWTAYYAATKKGTLTATFPFKSRHRRGAFEDQDGYYITMEKATPPANPAAATGFKCIETIVTGVAKSLKKYGSGDNWNGNVTITLSE